MPLAFPSHQGLLAPLWRRWPRRFSILALWVGALVPDAVDGVENVVVEGHFGQWICHSPLGATVLGLPVGLALIAALRALIAASPRSEHPGAVCRTWQRIADWLRGYDNCAATQRSFAARLLFDAPAVCIGAWSHVVFDLLSHEGSRLLWPFATDPAWFGAWWRIVWFRLHAPGYEGGYPIGPHFIVWLVLSIVGAVMFFRWPPQRR